MLLAIDSATRLMSLALHDGERLLAECTLAVDRKHSALLAPMIEQTLTQTDTAMSDLSALAVSVGPGSYTGLRIGLALAKGLAAARDLPLAPVTTLDTLAAAASAADRSLPLIATVPAGRSRIIWAVYHFQQDAWRAADDMKLASWQELLADCKMPVSLTGEIDETGLREIDLALEAGRRITLLAPAQRLRRAGFLAQLAWQQLRETGGTYRADLVMPIYLKSP